MSKSAFPNFENSSQGMTLRDYFASHAMMGLIARMSVKTSSKSGWEHLAEEAFIIADAMMNNRRD